LEDSDGWAASQIEIRPEREADHSHVFEVERAAFDSPVQANLVEALRASALPSLSLVALRDGEIVGHIFFSPVTLASAPSGAAAQLSPVAVAPGCQGQGIGSRLIRAGLEECPRSGWTAVFLVGNPLYYSRFGFEMAKPRGLSCGGPHDPFLQVLELDSDALAGVTGHVVFHPAFEELDPA
jgi:putative acetyltransferase